MVGERREEQVDGVEGGVGEGRAQGPQEVSAGATADGANPGQRREDGARRTREQETGPAGQLRRRRENSITTERNRGQNATVSQSEAGLT